MRISDWSSDVCSSDLLSAAAVLSALSCTPAHAEIYHCIVDGVPKFSDKPCHAGDAPVAVPDVTVVPAQKADSLTRQHDARVQQYQKARAEEDAAWGDESAARLANEARIRDARQRDETVAGMTEIGKASCRERGCEYV